MRRSLAWGRVVYGISLVLIGAVLGIGGARLILLGGSLYYLPAGLAAAMSGTAVLRGRWRTGACIYAALMAATCLYALAEVGLDGWALVPRVVSPAVLGLPFLLGLLIRGSAPQRGAAGATIALAAVLVTSVWAAAGFEPNDASTRSSRGQAGTADGEWRHIGNDQGGTHFSPLTQINRDNVSSLRVAWTAPIGPLPVKPVGPNQGVPVKIRDSLFVCTAVNDVLSLVPETGEVRWHYRARTKGDGLFTAKCRGVAYHERPGAKGECAAQVYTATNDARLIALDAATGSPCREFGADGVVDLLEGIDQRGPGYYRVTSAPAIVGGRLVIGGAVADGQHVGEPAGVVRAYDGATGKLVWAWDPGAPAPISRLEQGERYIVGTPNAWAPLSVDEALGLVFVPTGNATPDYWGAHRSAASNRHASAVVALDAATGAPRWVFQTTHYDVWDYDVASQPVLFDFQGPQGLVPALFQPTKRGQLFVLDRRTGTPIFPVVERLAPQEGAVEKLSATQPWSPALPDLAGPLLSERAMWGVTALDQLWCRIRFRQARYEGRFTPPGITYAIHDPGYIGGVNWGGATVDTERQLAYVVSNRIANRVRLVPRTDRAARHAKPDPASDFQGLVAQEGAPYALEVGLFLSPLGVPCQAPPYGLINAIDLSTGKMVWHRPLGNARDLGPLGWGSRLPVTVGTPTTGGAMSTASGLVFVGASQDRAVRAFDGESGKLLFEADLPGNSPSRPIAFRSARDQRQYIIVASEAPSKGGARYGALTAFALPATSLR